MADALKHFYDRALIVRLADSFVRAWPEFPRARFVRAAATNLEQLELMDRARQLARALADCLPADRARALQLTLDSLGPERADTGGEGMAGFFYMPHVLFVAEAGLGHFALAMRLQNALTRRFTAEFSIRAYLERHPERTLAQLGRWVTDRNPHVRRLVSEGTRPRLPWAPRLRAFERDPTPVLALLERLKDDPDPYVQRSVANNLNDIGKDHPQLLVDTCRRWARGAGPARKAIIARALRSRIKAGDQQAMAVLGLGRARGWTVQGRVEPTRVAIGQRARVVLVVRNGSRQAGSAAVDFAVHFIKASGDARPKVFKGQAVTLGPGQSTEIRRSISFAVHTTRVPRPGLHRVEALLGGQAVAIGAITLVE